MIFSCPLWGLYLQTSNIQYSSTVLSVFDQHIDYVCSLSDMCLSRDEYMQIFKNTYQGSRGLLYSKNIYSAFNLSESVGSESVFHKVFVGNVSIEYSIPSGEQISRFAEYDWSDSYNQIISDHLGEILENVKKLGIVGIDMKKDVENIYSLWMPLEKLYYPSSRLKPASSRFVKLVLPAFAKIVLPRLTS